MALSNEQWNAPSGGGDFFDHQIEHSIRVSNSAGDSTATNYLHLNATAGNSDIWTIGMWIKRARFATSNSNTAQAVWGGHSGSGSARGYGMVSDYTGTIGGMSFEDNNGSAWHITTRTNAIYRDLSAWTHVCWRYDSSQGTNTNRARMYVNGIVITDLQVSTYGAQGADHSWNGGGEQFIGTNGTGTDGNNPYQGFDGYIAEVVSIDGTSLDPMDNLVELKNGVLIPKDVSGLTFGDEGFWLQFKASDALGDDTSGNENDFTVVGIAAHDHMTDSPTFGGSTGGNFCTINPLFPHADIVLSQGNLQHATSTNQRGVMCNFGIPKSGNWYWEHLSKAFHYPTDHELHGVGINVQSVNIDGSDRGGRSTGITYASNQGKKFVESDSGATYGDAWEEGDIVGVEFDVDNGTINMSKNGSFQGDISLSSAQQAKEWFPYISMGGGTGAEVGIFNFGQDGTFAGEKTAQGNADANGFGDFHYAPPSGALALCSGNLPIGEGVDPAKDVDIGTLLQLLLYTGNANNSRAITTRFDPDVMWFKQRNAAKAWNAYSKIQGIGSTSNYLDFSKDDEIEPVSHSANKGLLATSATSMTVGAVDYINGNTLTYVATLFNLGNTQSTNNDGNLTSTIYANAGAGMSHGSYTGEGATKTVGHGLGVIPSFIIVKKTSADANWAVYYGDNTDGLVINSGAGTVDANFWADTTPSTSVFTVGNNATTGAAADYVFWAYANTEGFIKAGSYTGNGAVDGTFIYTGFKPALLIIKRKSGSESWMFMDHSRDPENVVEGVLQMNGTNGESTTDYDACDFLANGFKMRINDAGFNHAEDYIFLAIAKNSLKYATGR